MNEEKKIIFSVALVAVFVILCVGALMYYIGSSYTPQTTELTIEHLWEEGDRYYFADREGHVYRIGNLRDINEEILYKDIPKVRFEKLREGVNYECEYLKSVPMVSISEKEMGK